MIALLDAASSSRAGDRHPTACGLARFLSQNRAEVYRRHSAKSSPIGVSLASANAALQAAPKNMNAVAVYLQTTTALFVGDGARLIIYVQCLALTWASFG